ncbi:hypothetical protein BDY24DRAFT_82937 [Mrakia frigida]|uniref:uncharacterized protein n=1 Tax=Mrakia frigida TaxID=29902 RepID=UPI003FCC2681
MSTRRLRSFSLRHQVPWEVLLAVCQQSDEPTLKNLCLVSFGMLELAGPVLYEDVEIRTLQRLYSFFITPSLIPTASRLRPFLGLSRLQTLRTLIESPQEDLFDSIFPTSTWNLPNHRLQHSPRLSIRCLSVAIPPSAPLHDLNRLIWKKILRKIQPTSSIRIRHIPLYDLNPSHVLNYEATVVRTQDRRVERIVHVPVALALIIIPKVQTSISTYRSGERVLKVSAKLDLRLIVVAADWKEGVDATARAMLEDEVFWSRASEMEMEVLVQNEEVRKVVEEVVGGLSSERRSRCRVVQS